MNSDLKEWLEKTTLDLRGETLRRAPNMLPDAEALDIFLGVLARCLDRRTGSQLHAIQAWALKEIGPDTAVANDWLTMFRSLKEVIGDHLYEDFSAQEAFRFWRDLDHIFNFAIIETTRLAGDLDRITLLEHMVNLRRQLDQLDKSKAGFITVAAHELRTPLTVMEGYANMLKADLPADKPHLHTFLEGLNNGTRRLREIIADMIDVAMIDSHAFSINFQPVYLEKIVRAVATNMVKALQERQVELQIEPFILQEPVYGDPERLYKAFDKIIVNGLKYTPDGGRITISTILTRPAELSEDIAGYLDIHIKDTGIGINPEDLDLIFEKFSRTTEVALHSTGKTKFKGGGPGLGLPIVKGIVEAHGGRVWAESAGYDEMACPGSIFHIELPIRLRPPRVNEKGIRDWGSGISDPIPEL